MEAEVFCVKFDDDDTMLSAATTDGTIRIYSLSNGSLLKELAGSDTYTPTTCLKFLTPKNIFKIHDNYELIDGDPLFIPIKQKLFY